MISQDIFRRADERDPKNPSIRNSSSTLKTPDVLLEGDFVELPQEGGTSSPLFMSFDMEDVTLHNSTSHAKYCFVDSFEDNTDSTVEQISSFVKMLASKSNTVKFEAASALLHVLSIDHIETVVECGALPALIQALTLQKEKVRDECVKCLDIIIKSSTRFREQLLRHGGLIPLLKCADEATGDNSRANALRTISNIFSNGYQPKFELVASSIPVFIRMLGSDRDPIIIVECSKMLNDFMHCYPDLNRLLLDLGAKKLLQNLLSHEDESVVVSSIRLTRHLISPRGERVQSSNGTAFSNYSYSSSLDYHQGAKGCDKKIDPQNHSHNYSRWRSGRFPHGMPSNVVTPISETVTKFTSPSRFHETPEKQRFASVERNHLDSYQCKRSTNTAPGLLWRGNFSPPIVFSDTYARECTSKVPCKVDSSPLVHLKNFAYQDTAQSPEIPQVVRLSRSLHNGEKPDYKLHQNLSPEKPGTDVTSTARDEDQHNAPITTECEMNDDILLDGEKYMLSDYTVLVLEQLRPCRIQNKQCLPDSRYPFPLGFPGLECKHCAGTKEARRFFWSTAVRFKNNNGEFAKHLFKCTHCPDTVKEQMNFMKTYHTRQMKSLPRGKVAP